MYEDIGRLILRLALGGMIAVHGIDKLIRGIDPIVGGVASRKATGDSISTA
jgi:uncharacterized membrane protein YphA (DoxX/SURF4 family)